MGEVMARRDDEGTPLVQLPDDFAAVLQSTEARHARWFIAPLWLPSTRAHLHPRVPQSLERQRRWQAWVRSRASPAGLSPPSSLLARLPQLPEDPEQRRRVVEGMRQIETLEAQLRGKEAVRPCVRRPALAFDAMARRALGRAQQLEALREEVERLRAS